MDYNQQGNYNNKAIDSWHNARISFSRILPYAGMAIESLTYYTIWLGSVLYLTQGLNPSKSDTSPAKLTPLATTLPQQTQNITMLYNQIRGCLNQNNIPESQDSTNNKDNNIIQSFVKNDNLRNITALTSTAALYNYASSPQDGANKVKIFCNITGYFLAGSYHLIKAGYYWLSHYGVSESKTHNNLLPSIEDRLQDINLHISGEIVSEE
ncbi:MAG: hypothetical protein H6909_02610 [Rickettsiaceae bacterium]|nr:hypothetical protein [Ignavibacteriota bacterium]MCP5369563.1 hypothetical protein [Rickettsiaceae bacterium]